MSKELEQSVVKVWELVVKNISRVLDECDLHGMSGIIYVKDPSLEERLEILRDVRQVFGLALKHIKDDGVRQKISDSNVCVSNLEILLSAVRNDDNETFEFSKKFLENMLPT